MQNTATATMPQVILQQDSVPAFTVLKKLKPVQLQDLCKLERDTTALVSHKVKTEARHCPFLASAYTKHRLPEVITNYLGTAVDNFPFRLLIQVHVPPKGALKVFCEVQLLLWTRLQQWNAGLGSCS